MAFLPFTSGIAESSMHTTSYQVLYNKSTNLYVVVLYNSFLSKKGISIRLVKGSTLNKFAMIEDYVCQLADKIISKKNPYFIDPRQLAINFEVAA